MKNPEVSVCMITYNHERYIDQAIEGCLAQKTDFNFELIIGEDCSNDRTLKICKSYQIRSPEIIKLIINNTNIGTMSNFVNILNLCRGKYIALCEGDDYWIDPNKLQSQVEFLEMNPDYILCFTDRAIADKTGNILKEHSIPEDKKRDLGPADVLGGFTPPTQTVVFRKINITDNLYNALLKVYNGDLLLFGFLSTLGKFGYIDSITAVYRHHPAGIYSRENQCTRLANRLKSIQILNELIGTEYSIMIAKSRGVILKRLFVLYFKKRKFIAMLKIYLQLLKNDWNHKTINSIKAFKLLIISMFKSNSFITD